MNNWELFGAVCLLPEEGIKWLNEQNFRAADHDTRMELLREAKEMFLGENS